MSLFRKLMNRMGFVPKVSTRGYSGAAVNRLNNDWVTGSSSADAEIRKDVKKLRDRSRDLERNNDYVRRYAKCLENNVLGSTGVTLQMKVKEVTRKGSEYVETYDKDANFRIESAWDKWGKKKNCTLSGELSWKDVQRLVLRRAAFDGGILVKTIKGAPNDFGFALQIIEMDHLDIEFNAMLSNGNAVRMGVEFNSNRRPVAYHLLTVHPGETFGFKRGEKFRERIDAAEIIHVFFPDRPEQTIGVPWLISAIVRLNMLGAYEEAELVAARIGASKMGFFQSATPEEYKGTPAEDGTTITEAEPGAFEDLPMGKTFVPWDPQHPTQAFPAFVKACLRGIASGLGVSYNTLANDIESVNFSSIRAGLLEEREEWKTIQAWFIEHFIEPVFEPWLEVSMLSGALTLPLSKLDKFNAAEWKARRWPWVDPLKDVQANVVAVEKGFRSRRAIISEAGGDIEEVFGEQREDKALEELNGLNFPIDGASAPVGGEETPEGLDEIASTKALSDAYGVAVRAGAITPTEDDEDHFRTLLKIPSKTKSVSKAWSDDGGVRRPITLLQKGDSVTAAPAPVAIPGEE